MVRRFLRGGDDVVFTYRASEDRALALAKEGGAAAIRMDVSKPGSAQELLAELAARGRAVDVLVNNAGVALNRLVLDTTDEEFRRVVDTNLYGAFALTRAVLPGMLERRRGAIVNISSIWGRTGGSCEGVYAASKAALIAFTRATAIEVGSAGIRVNAIAPGYIDTDMNRALDEEARASLAEEIPLGRAGTPGEVAEAAWFLAGDAAGYITVTTLNVDGGWRC